EQDPTLELVEPTPDTVRFTDAKCVFETVLAHRARGADGFRALLAIGLLVLALEGGRREKHHRLRPTTGRPNLPFEFRSLRSHGHSYPRLRTISPPSTIAQDGLFLNYATRPLRPFPRWRARWPQKSCSREPAPDSPSPLPPRVRPRAPVHRSRRRAPLPP